MDWNGKRVLIIGAARQGLALTRYLARQGARIILNDRRDEDALASARESLDGLNVRWVLGSHPTSLLQETDLVCVSGGVPLELPLLDEAMRQGIPFSNDTEIFLQAVPTRVIGITGSAGKTTTTSLAGRMAQAVVPGPQKVWVGGNIGNPLVDCLDEIKTDDLVILELSSFQLELVKRSPQVAAVLNITPNHLDRHGTLEAYTAAKARILDFQDDQGIAVLNRDDPGSWNLQDHVRGGLFSFGIQKPQGEFRGTYFADERLFWNAGKDDYEILSRGDILLRGEHNLMNVLAAAAIVLAAGLPAQAVPAGVKGFGGVAHRLEYVRTWKGADWYNDSIATAPERTSAAIHAFDEPIVLLLGGHDKDLPWDELAHLIHQRVDHVVVFGEAAGIILRALGPVKGGQRPFTITRSAGLFQAVQAAAELVEAGDVVLLSPGCASFDEFFDFEARGEAFRLWVNRLQ